MMNTRPHRSLFVRVIVLIAVLGALAPALTPRAAAQTPPRLVNLAHLEFLRDTVPYPAAPPPGHTTVDPGTPLDAWWTYADRNADGTYRRVGGGAYDEGTNTWSQGAYNLDDVARIALVYLLHYRTYGDELSRDRAYGALRHVLYLQTLTPGDDQGNFVLWMQPNGDLNPSPTPQEFPDPSDSDFSWWAVRAMWAMAEGYDLFKTERPAFAAVLQQRMTLAMQALDRQVIQGKYGTYLDLHGYRVPNWFVREGADASSDAVQALTRYYDSSGDALAARLATQLAEALDEFQFGDATSWSFRAHLPYARSLTLWHAWGGRQMQALSTAGQVFDRPEWIKSATEEANTFLPHEYISIGPINGLLPAPNELVQINYGNETIVNNLLATAKATGNPVYSQLAGLQATWWLGNNSAGQPMYDPATGRGYDGIEPDGRINRNSGAESVLSALYGLLNVLQDPVAARYLRYTTPIDALGWQKIDAETGTVGGDAGVATPPSAWTGEALWSGGKYVRLGVGGEVSVPVDVPVTGRYRLFIVYDKQPGNVAIDVRLLNQPILRHEQGGAEPPGDSPNASYLWMDSVLFPNQIRAGTQNIVLRGVQGEARIDAILLQPLVEYRTVADTNNERATLAKSFAPEPVEQQIVVNSATVCVQTVKLDGQIVEQRTRAAPNNNVVVRIPAFGYAFVENGACRTEKFTLFMPVIANSDQ